jgi:putative membrane protein
MNEPPYRDVPAEEMILRDHLATDRTLLANERTLLAYVRTALAFLLCGVGTLKFFQSRLALAAAVVFMILAALTTVIGLWRFRTVNARYAPLRFRDR